MLSVKHNYIVIQHTTIVLSIKVCMPFCQTHFRLIDFFKSVFPNHHLVSNKNVFVIVLCFELTDPITSSVYMRLSCSFGTNTFNCSMQTFHKCCILLQSKNKWRIVSILLLHKLHIPFEYPMRRNLCSVNITLCINFHWNSLQLLKQYESKTLFQIVIQFIELSCNLTCHSLYIN